MRLDVNMAKQNEMDDLIARTCYIVSKTQKSLCFEVLNATPALNFSCRLPLRSRINIFKETLTTCAHFTPVFIVSLSECHISRHFLCIILTAQKMKLNLTKTFTGWKALTKEVFFQMAQSIFKLIWLYDWI